MVDVVPNDRRGAMRRISSRLRRILWAHLVFAIIKSAIDCKYSPITTIFDGIGVIWPAVWLPYFYRSVREGHVFVPKDWRRVAESVRD